MNILRKADEVAPYRDQIRRLADSNKDALGFLPAAVYPEQMLRGKLWVAVEGEEFLGFLLFGGRFPTLKVQQLGVLPEARHRQVGSSLVGHLARYGEQRSYLRIKARVAADLPANSFWESVGFQLVKQEQGGVTTRRIINIRVKTLETPSLFADYREEDAKTIQGRQLDFRSPLHSTPSFAIDLNVFFDVTKRRVDHEYSSHVLGEGFRAQVRLFITPEFIEELERRTFDPDPNLELAKSLPRLEKVDAATMKRLTEDLKKLVFPDRSEAGRRWPQSLSDLRHLAYCINARITGFVTREEALLRAAPALREKYSLEVLAPLDICGTQVGELDDHPLATFKHNGDEIVVGRGGDESIIEIVSRFCGNRKQKEVLAHEFFDSANRRVCIFHDGLIIAAAAWKPSGGIRTSVRVVAVVDETSLLRERAVDHILESIFREGEPQLVRTIEMRFLHVQESLEETAWRKGFRRMGGGHRGWVKLSVSGALARSNWPTFADSLHELTGLRISQEAPDVEVFENTGVCVYSADGSIREAIRLFDFETFFSPGLVLCPGRHGLIVPIQLRYARDLLFDPMRRGMQLSLLPANIPLYLERAYFRSLRGHGAFRRGLPIVFYVSKASGGPGEAIGWARCTYSGTPTARQARRLLSRQGVLAERELEELSRGGKLHAFSFDNFNLFPRRINLEELKACDIVSGANLVTFQRLAPKQLKQVLHMAYGKIDR